jgi:cell division protein ZapE
MRMTTTTTGTVHLTQRTPELSGAQMVAALVPPPQFADATFETYRADPEYPSQQEAKDLLLAFSGRAPAERGGLFRRPKRAPEMKPGVYLDGGFGVGKTHLLAAIYHALPARRKYFGSFIEYTALVGAMGYQNTVALFKGADLLCIDEFELDDPMVMTRLLGELVASGTRLAATSNTPPNALGEGRFAAQDFLREIHAMSASFQTIRIDGTDFRHRSVDGHATVLAAEEYAGEIATLGAAGMVSDDSFDELIAHLSRVHPSRYIRLIADLDAVGLRDVAPFTDQSAALRFVAFIDRVYDAELPIRATGTSLDLVFPEEMLAGGYRKKYLRAISRLVASTLA